MGNTLVVIGRSEFKSQPDQLFISVHIKKYLNLKYLSFYKVILHVTLTIKPSSQHTINKYKKKVGLSSIN